jgi:hypothetical protein
MKTTTLFCYGCISAAWLITQPVTAQSENVTRGADVKGTDVKGTDVKGADVKGADVKGADVKGADVKGADVKGADVKGADVNGGSVSGGTITPGTVTPGTVTAFADGREIQVRAVDAVTVNVNGANAEIKIGNQMLVVQKTKLMLDGKALADMPAKAKKVDVEVKDRTLSVRADGKELTKTALK